MTGGGCAGGHTEMVGIDPEVQAQICKLASGVKCCIFPREPAHLFCSPLTNSAVLFPTAGLCSTVTGQIVTSLMVCGPDEDDESHALHEGEKDEIFQCLKRRSKIVSEGLNEVSGFSCKPAGGSMCCSPAVNQPPGAMREAEKWGMAPDTIHSVSLLQSPRICAVSASGLGQKERRFSFRTAFLPAEEEMEFAVEMICDHCVSSLCKQCAC